MVTVGLWESKKPPKADALRKLEEIARAEACRYFDEDREKYMRLINLAARFTFLRGCAVKDEAGFDVATSPRIGERDMETLAFVQASGFWESFSVQLLPLFWGILRSGTPAQKRKPQKMLDDLADVVRSVEPMAFNTIRAFALAAARNEELAKT